MGVVALRPGQQLPPPSGREDTAERELVRGRDEGQPRRGQVSRSQSIVVHGHGTQRLCYRVTKRVEVLATARVPAYYSRTGTPQLAIIVCSGRRLGPGQWEKRTIWYASPSS